MTGALVPAALIIFLTAVEVLAADVPPAVRTEPMFPVLMVVLRPVLAIVNALHVILVVLVKENIKQVPRTPEDGVIFGTVLIKQEANISGVPINMHARHTAERQSLSLTETIVQ